MESSLAWTLVASLAFACPAAASGRSAARGAARASARAARVARASTGPSFASPQRGGFALRSFSAARFAPRSAFSGFSGRPLASGFGFHALGAPSGSAGSTLVSIPPTGGRTAWRGEPGFPVGGTMMLGTALGGGSSTSLAAVPAGAIALNSGSAVGVAGGAGVTWSAPSGAGNLIGAGGATTNSLPGAAAPPLGPPAGTGPSLGALSH